MKRDCSYCGMERAEVQMTRVKVSVGEDLYFCKTPNGAPQRYTCTEEVIGTLEEQND